PDPVLAIRAAVRPSAVHGARHARLLRTLEGNRAQARLADRVRHRGFPCDALSRPHAPSRTRGIRVGATRQTDHRTEIVTKTPGVGRMADLARTSRHGRFGVVAELHLRSPKVR